MFCHISHMTRFQLLLPVQSQNITKILYCIVWIGKIWPFGRENQFCAKKHLKNGYFCVHESELPDFGRTWTPNRWHQVNFWGGPENFGVLRFRLAMWKVGGTKLERTRDSYIFVMCVHWNSQKVIFWVKRSVPKNFQREIFLGLVSTESLRTQDSENVYERWVQQIFDHVLVARSWVSATKWGPLAKLLAVAKNKHGHNFQNIGSKLNQRGLIDYEPTLIQFGSDILKIVAVLVFGNGSF